MKIQLCLGSACFARGNKNILSYLEKKTAADSGLEMAVCLCRDRCAEGPNAVVDGEERGEMSLGKMKEILGDVE